MVLQTQRKDAQRMLASQRRWRQPGRSLEDAVEDPTVKSPAARRRSRQKGCGVVFRAGNNLIEECTVSDARFLRDGAVVG
jgi:hypothetical protein